MFDPRNSVSSSLEPTTNLGAEFSPSLEVVRDDIAALLADHPALELQCAKGREVRCRVIPGQLRDGSKWWWGGQGLIWHEGTQG